MSIHLAFRTLLVVAALAAAGIAACSGDDDSDSTGGASTGAATTTTTSATTSAATGATGGASTGAASDSLAVTLASDSLGSYLVGPDGRTLYVFLEDAPATVNCTGNCLEIWPPLLLEDGQEVEAGDGIEGSFGSVDTPSGAHVTYNQVPLYYFVSDTAPGQTTGHLVGNVWFVARPDTASTSFVIVQEDADTPFLVGPTGMTLYTFDNDTEGVSNCTGTCLEAWPALIIPEGMEPTTDGADGALGTITRDDGVIQITYEGLPLYYYIGDSLPGDTNGDGVGDVWHLALP